MILVKLNLTGASVSYLNNLNHPDQSEFWRSSKPHLRFVLKMHQATSLHYDFRLELDGVLLSWVLRQPPRFDPKWRLRAIPVDDHALVGLLTERRIPKGRYGAGPMLIADHGTYAPAPCSNVSHEKQVRDQLRHGRLTFRLYGVRHQGLWCLYKEADRWFFQKGDDDFASKVQPYWDGRSVISGKALEQI